MNTYDGSGNFKKDGKAVYNIYLPKPAPGDSYTFGPVYNVSTAVENKILICMQSTLNTALADLDENTVPYEFELLSSAVVTSNSAVALDLGKNTIEVALFHNDKPVTANQATLVFNNAMNGTCGIDGGYGDPKKCGTGSMTRV
ncbi:hypothetical protein [Flavobacterium kingsejongi]|uniref:Uncharacterized protein n=1 Tax=Flavobacterium kingsejongi TaxID=1678728 RepID=A0A2S1LQE2_9FLAO|nr:hypothetical protein [Flavobacterium kingsejongi]AWG25866.1 hypothetical protein FK004_11865 [Flavobacterium kingsejongi]